MKSGPKFCRVSTYCWVGAPLFLFIFFSLQLFFKMTTFSSPLEDCPESFSLLEDCPETFSSPLEDCPESFSSPSEDCPVSFSSPSEDCPETLFSFRRLPWKFFCQLPMIFLTVNLQEKSDSTYFCIVRHFSIKY